MSKTSNEATADSQFGVAGTAIWTHVQGLIKEYHVSPSDSKEDKRGELLWYLKSHDSSPATQRALNEAVTAAGIGGLPQLEKRDD
ncbi:hypothetical protein P7C73_g1119, partial [Tremellales sp. Uapishka_1]